LASAKEIKLTAVIFHGSPQFNQIFLAHVHIVLILSPPSATRSVVSASDLAFFILLYSHDAASTVQMLSVHESLVIAIKLAICFRYYKSELENFV
jgi:hypothetical protein